jgi:putative nucleotidyltransferase with HDIG domain
MLERAHAFIAATAAIAVSLILLSLSGDLPTISAGDALGLACFVAISLIAEAAAVDFKLGGGRQAKSSLAFLPFISATLLFEPFLTVLVVVSVIAVSQFLFRRNDMARGLFNVSQACLSAYAGAYAYAWAGGDATQQHVNFVAFILLSSAFFATNLTLNTVALSLIRETSLLETAKQVLGYRGANLWFDLLASPIAIVPAALYPDYNVTGLLVILLPLLLIRYSYMSKVKIEEANKDLLQVLVKAIETRDPYTSGHSLRVATLARAIAEDMGFTQRQIERIETAALLHDIGKIDSIYEVVIRKPYDLTSSERELIRTHATKGADLLETLSSVDSSIIRAVRHHHERYDGTGYPSGLAGDDIPVASRIIMLCDSIDAMLSDRPYRKALTIEQTRHELVRCCGTQFDPNVVTIILQRSTLERAVALVERPVGWDVQPMRLVPIPASA